MEGDFSWDKEKSSFTKRFASKSAKQWCYDYFVSCTVLRLWVTFQTAWGRRFWATWGRRFWATRGSIRESVYQPLEHTWYTGMCFTINVLWRGACTFVCLFVRFLALLFLGGGVELLVREWLTHGRRENRSTVDKAQEEVKYVYLHQQSNVLCT